MNRSVLASLGAVSLAASGALGQNKGETKPQPVASHNDAVTAVSRMAAYRAALDSLEQAVVTSRAITLARDPVLAQTPDGLTLLSGPSFRRDIWSMRQQSSSLDLWNRHRNITERNRIDMWSLRQGGSSMRQPDLWSMRQRSMEMANKIQNSRLDFSLRQVRIRSESALRQQYFNDVLRRDLFNTGIAAAEVRSGNVPMLFNKGSNMHRMNQGARDRFSELKDFSASYPKFGNDVLSDRYRFHISTRGRQFSVGDTKYSLQEIRFRFTHDPPGSRGNWFNAFKNQAGRSATSVTKG